MIPGSTHNQSQPICVTVQTFPGLDYEEHGNGSPWFIVNVIPLGVSESNQLGACQNLKKKKSLPSLWTDNVSQSSYCALNSEI